MAFATSNVSRGVQGNHKVLTGNWTGTVGDAAGTLTLEGGTVYDMAFNSHKTDGPVERCHAAHTSTSGAIATVTVYNHETVTAGTFRIEYL